MSTSQRVGGYTWRQDVAQGRSAEGTARRYVGRILDERPGPALAAMYLARIGVALGEIAAALTDLERIGRGAREERTDRPAR